MVLAAPVRSLVPLARAIAADVAPDALVIDIGSVKGPVIAGVEATALAGRFVGCHPLAGTEASGPGAADATLYAGKPCFICPGAASGRRGHRPGPGVLGGAGRQRPAAGSPRPTTCSWPPAATCRTWRRSRWPPAWSPTPTCWRRASRAATRPPACATPPGWPPRTRPSGATSCSRTAPTCCPGSTGWRRSSAALQAALESEDAGALEALLERGRRTRRRIVK